MRDTRPDEYRAVWESKPVLRAIYSDYYRRMLCHCRPGPTLEIGGGSGNLKAFAPEVISTDILEAPWLDTVADAQALPFAEASFHNLVMLDVLHHIPQPRRFLAEAVRVLRSGGRLVLIEPTVTPLSWPFYRFLHPEGVDLSVDPLANASQQVPHDAFDANQAIPTLLFWRHRRRLEAEFPALRVLRLERLSLLCYPLSGGFRRWSFVPARLVPGLLRLEDRVAPLLGALAAFRMLAVLERI